MRRVLLSIWLTLVPTLAVGCLWTADPLNDAGDVSTEANDGGSSATDIATTGNGDASDVGVETLDVVDATDGGLEADARDEVMDIVDSDDASDTDGINTSKCNYLGKDAGVCEDGGIFYQTEELDVMELDIETNTINRRDGGLCIINSQGYVKKEEWKGLCDGTDNDCDGEKDETCPDSGLKHDTD